MTNSDMKIGTVFIRVSDINKSKEWYQNSFNFKINWQEEKICAFCLGETDLTLVEQDLESLKDVSFNLFCKDVKAFRDSLIEKSISVSNFKKWENIEYFSCKDLDGNLIEICSILNIDSFH